MEILYISSLDLFGYSFELLRGKGTMKKNVLMR